MIGHLAARPPAETARAEGDVIHQIERQFVADGAAAVRPSRDPARVGDRARRSAVRLAPAAGAGARAAPPHQPHHRRQRLSRARVARAAARLRRARHVRVRGARAGGHAVRVAREDRLGGAALERLDAARRAAALVGRAAAVAGGRRTGDRLLSDRGVSARPSTTCSRTTRAPRGATGRPKDNRRCATRSPSASACRPRACWCSPARSRGSTCSRGASSIRATPSSSIGPAIWARFSRSARPARS